MGWDSKTEVVLVINPDRETAQEWIDSIEDKRGRLFVWAPRFSSVVGRNPATTFFEGVGDFDICPEAAKAYYWCKDHGYREWWREASK